MKVGNDVIRRVEERRNNKSETMGYELGWESQAEPGE